MVRKILLGAVFLNLVHCGGESSTEIKNPKIVGTGGAPGSGGAGDAAGSGGAARAGTAGRGGSGGAETAGAESGGRSSTGGSGAAGTTSAGSGGMAGGLSRCGSTCSVPPGRPEPVACPVTDVSRFIGPDAGAGGTDSVSCSVDADCATTGAELGLGYCLKGQCAADQCLTDGDCPSGHVCGCSTQFGGNALHTNRCVASTCNVDGDCGANGVCSPATTGYCGSLAGYYCHTTDDECHTSTDCVDKTKPTCDYQMTLGYWACQAVSVCAG
jgi:hypothetical protein